MRRGLYAWRKARRFVAPMLVRHQIIVKAGAGGARADPSYWDKPVHDCGRKNKRPVAGKVRFSCRSIAKAS